MNCATTNGLFLSEKLFVRNGITKSTWNARLAFSAPDSNINMLSTHFVGVQRILDGMSLHHNYHHLI